jgi:hypothetical protein
MFKKLSFEVWRSVPATGFADESWAFSHNLSLGYESVGHQEGIQANQNAALIRGVAYFYGNVPPNLTTKDLIKDPSGVTVKIQSIEAFQNGLIPHFEIYLMDSQWRVK